MAARTLRKFPGVHDVCSFELKGWRMRESHLLTAAVATVLIGRGLAPVFALDRCSARTRGSPARRLTGWNTVGDASWRAENGEIIGTPKSGGRLAHADDPFRMLASTRAFDVPPGARRAFCSAPKRRPRG